MSSGKLTSPFLIHSVAPIRICDNGGWTDTWFSDKGRLAPNELATLAAELILNGIANTDYATIRHEAPESGRQ